MTFTCYAFTLSGSNFLNIYFDSTHHIIYSLNPANITLSTRQAQPGLNTEFWDFPEFWCPLWLLWLHPSCLQHLISTAWDRSVSCILSNIPTWFHWLFRSISQDSRNIVLQWVEPGIYRYTLYTIEYTGIHYSIHYRVHRVHTWHDGLLDHPALPHGDGDTVGVQPGGVPHVCLWVYQGPGGEK